MWILQLTSRARFTMLIGQWLLQELFTQLSISL
jgi:hypothetical protein